VASALLAGQAVGADGPEVSDEQIAAILDAFSHESHGEAFEESGLWCLSCHQLGSRPLGEETVWPSTVLDEIFGPPPSPGCHFCHRPEDKSRASGPQGCQTCHGEGFEPQSHGLGWQEEHGVEVRMIKPVCRDCHDTAWCISCHEQRGALSGNPHPPGWGAVHGVEARFDPQTCVTCHSGESCVSCHESGRSPW